MAARSQTTILDRLDWIRVNLGKAGTPLSERDLCELAGLSHTVISVLRGRFDEDPKASLSTDSLLAFSRIARVPAEWLAEGVVATRTAPTEEEIREALDILGRSRKPGA